MAVNKTTFYFFFTFVNMLINSSMSMEHPEDKNDDLINKILNNPEYNHQELQELLNDVLDDLPVEMARLPQQESVLEHKQDDKKERSLSEVINQHFDKQLPFPLMGDGGLFLINNPTDIYNINYALNRSHQVILDCFSPLNYKADFHTQDLMLSIAVLAKIKFLFFVEILTEHINGNLITRYPFFQKFPAIQNGKKRGVQPYTYDQFKRLNSYDLIGLLHELESLVDIAYQRISKEIMENLSFKVMRPTSWTEYYKCRIQKIKKKMGEYIGKYVLGVNVEDKPGRAPPIINLNINNNLVEWKVGDGIPAFVPRLPQLPPLQPLIPDLPIKIKAVQAKLGQVNDFYPIEMNAREVNNQPPAHLHYVPPPTHILPPVQVPYIPHQEMPAKRALPEPGKENGQPPLKRRASVNVNPNLKKVENMNGARFYGDPTKAEPATLEERNKYKEILRSLKEHKKALPGDNYHIAKSAIKLIAQFHIENTQVCQNIYAQFEKGAEYYLSYQHNPEIVIHCEQPDMNIEERAPHLYSTLKNSYELALQEGVLPSFFTHAFISPETGLICLEGAQKMLAGWYEDQIILLSARNQHARINQPTIGLYQLIFVVAEEHNVYESLQEALSTLEKEMKIPELRSHTLATYKNFLNDLKEFHGTQEMQNKLQQAEEYFEKHATVELLTEKVVAILQAKTYAVESDKVSELIRTARGAL